MNNNKHICGAKTKSTGGPCQRPPVKGRDRCSLHGGHQPRGRDHHNFKHGLYSKYAGADLKTVLDELEGMDPEQLTRVDNELKLLQALIIRSKTIERGTGDLDDLDTISKVIERLIKSKQRAVALRIEENRLVPVADIRIFLDYVEQTIERFTGRDDTYEIMNQLKNFKISDHEN